MKNAAHHRRAMAPWQPLSLFLIVTVAPTLARAQSLVQLFGNSAGAVSSVASVQVAQDQFVTAVINSTGNLEIIGWFADFTNDQLVRQGTWYAGPASAVAVSSPFALNVGISGVFTTAAINANRQLDIIHWHIQSNGAISMIAETQGDTTWDVMPWDVSIASVYNSSAGSQQFVTAIVNAAGNLEVSHWYVNSRNHIVLSGSATAGQVFSVSIACLHDSNSDVITAVSNSAVQEELIQWWYGGSGIVREGTTYTSTPAFYPAVAPGVSYTGNPPYFVNAFYTAEINSYTIQNTVSAWNQALGLQVQGVAGNDSTAVLVGNNSAAIEAATIPTNSYNGVDLSVFDATPSTTGFGKVAGAQGFGPRADSISLVDTSSPNVTVFAVSGRQGTGTSNLQIQVWSYVRACSPYCSW